MVLPLVPLAIALILILRLFASSKNSAGALQILARLLGWCLTLATFPGVILREVSHKVTCDLSGTEVFEAMYFRWRYPVSYVLHARVSRYRYLWLHAIAPLAMNSACAVALFLPHVFGASGTVDFLSLWLGFSCAANAFPDEGDAQVLWRQTKLALGQAPLAYLGYPLVILTRAAHWMKLAPLAGIAYALALYSVTFCGLAAVLIAGSTAFPGTYSAKIVSATPGWITAEKLPQELFGYFVPQKLSSLPAHQNPVPAIDSTTEEGSASNWLPLAEAAVKKENANVVFIQVYGRSDKIGTSLPIDGKSSYWTYQYLSPADDSIYNVQVSQGRVIAIEKPPRNLPGSIVLNSEEVQILNWTIDSEEAAATANLKVRQMTGGKAPDHATYLLKREGSPAYWNLNYYDQTEGWMAAVSIDAETGRVLSSYSR